MAKYLIDANLPYLFSLWKSSDFLHVFDIDDELSDEEIWNYAMKNSLTIITKDADFSNKIIFKTPPPKVIHLKIGNMKMKEFHSFLQKNWSEIESISQKHKLTNVYIDRIEGLD
ncbi:MAG: DUF5615 family PIN-like protein [Bacteroidales bacterium]|nr:DUF5615 family PIN-like protein [Bacteroidales bacterium]MCF8334786.1 DUF5615 family PIN-like protein [Bacteroidales bacterium]